MLTINNKQAQEIKKTCALASKKNAIGAYENIRIDVSNCVMTMTAGDSTVEIERIIDIDSDIDFSVAVNATKLSQIVSSCSGDLKISVKDSMVITSGRKRFTLGIFDAESYPIMESIGEGESIDPLCLSDIDLVSFASAKDDVRYYINGVYIGSDTVATNGHMMALSPNGDIKNGVILPISSINQIPKDIKSAEIFSNALIAKGDGYTFKCRIIDGKYPDYKRAIPICNKSSVASKSDLIDALKSSIITANEFRSISMLIASDSISISSSVNKNNDKSQITIDAKSDHEFEFKVNVDYLLSAIGAVDSEVIDLKFSDSHLMIDSHIKVIISGVR